MIKSSCTLVALVGASLFCAVSVMGQVDPAALRAPGTVPSADDPLPYFDIRLDADGLAVEEVLDALAVARTESQLAARATSIAQIEQDVRGVRVADHEFFGTPHYIGSTMRLLTPPAAVGDVSAREVVKDFVATYQPVFEIDPEALDVTRVRRDFVTKHNGVTHLTFQQQIDGVDLFGAHLRTSVTSKGEIINISSAMIPRPVDGFAPSPIEISPLDAIHAAAENIAVTMTVDPVPLGIGVGAVRKQTWSHTPDFRDDTAITTELVYFPRTRTDVRSAWSLVLPRKGIGNTYEIIVDATTGEVLRRWNRLHFGGTEPMSMRIFTSDSPAPQSPGADEPDGSQFPFVPRDFVTFDPADITPFSPNGWIDDGVNETIGNNVDAHTDLDANNNPDLPRPQGSPFRVFDFPFDETLSPSTYREASVTQLFYLCNLYHDRLYGFGWDEAAANYQEDNFGNGGVGGDRLQADAQDGAGTNNANFNISFNDGEPGRMQMFIFTGPNPDRDGDLDAEIVFHEYSHGLSERLLEGGVFGEQSGGMGEGWGDYFGIALLAEATDDPNANYAIGGHTTYLLWSGYDDNYYFGIRRFPYSTDMNKNPETYADLDPGQISFPPGVPRNTNIGNTADEVHNVGEVWCVTLMDARANLWDVHGFAGNELLMQLVVDGMKITPSNPNFLQARDGIIQADLVNNDGANLLLLWAAFAKRGMGGSATSPSGSTTTGIVEAFDMPSFAVFTYPEGIPEQLTPDVETTFKVAVEGLGPIAPISGTGELHYSINGGPTTSVPMVETAPNEYDVTLPAASCFDGLAFYISVETTGGVETDPAGAPAETFTATVFTDTIVAFDDDFETNLGWTVGDAGDNASTGVWVRVDPNGTEAQPEDDHTDPGTMCFVTGQGSPGGGLGQNDVDGGKTTLLSPIFDATAEAQVVSYWRWYSNTTGNAPNTDTFRVDISNNGGAGWVNVETLGAGFGGEHDGGWFFHSFVVDDVISPTTQMRMRFVAEDDPTDGDGSLVEAAIDDFLVFFLECEDTATCEDGVQNQGEDRIDCGGPCPACECTADATCDDGTFCNGGESCDAFGTCQSGSAPCGGGTWCDDGGDTCVPFGNGDFDVDGDVDLRDFMEFSQCFGANAAGGCEPGNMTGDGTIDLGDYELFRAALTGP